MPSHFIAQITDTEGKGPDPEAELDHLCSQIEVNGEAWFKSPYQGANFEQAGNSTCVIFRKDGEYIDAVVARILPRAGQMPAAQTQAFYAGYHNLKTWWKIGGLRLDPPRRDFVRVGLALKRTPGSGWKTHLTADEVFGGEATISGWDFGNVNPLMWIQQLVERAP